MLKEILPWMWSMQTATKCSSPSLRAHNVLADHHGKIVVFGGYTTLDERELTHVNPRSFGDTWVCKLLSPECDSLPVCRR